MNELSNKPLWAPDTGTGGGFEMDLTGSDESSQEQPSPESNVDQLVREIQNNPVARQAAIAALGLNESSPPQPVTPTDPVSELRQELSKVEQQLAQNPSDAEAFARKIALEAQIGSLEQAQKMMAPVVVQQQVTRVMQVEVPRILDNLSKDYPNFDAYKDRVVAELQQAMLSQPELASNQALLQQAAEVLADRHFSAYARSSQTPTGVPGTRAFAGGTGMPTTPKVEGLTDEEAQAFQEAKRFYPDLAPEDWKAYKQGLTDDEAEFPLQIKNVMGRSAK